MDVSRRVQRHRSLWWPLAVWKGRAPSPEGALGNAALFPV